jgi:hypothetical protein
MMIKVKKRKKEDVKFRKITELTRPYTKKLPAKYHYIPCFARRRRKGTAEAAPCVPFSAFFRD